MRENGGRHQYGRWEGATALTIGHFSRFNRSPSASNGSRIGYETEAWFTFLSLMWFSSPLSSPYTQFSPTVRSLRVRVKKRRVNTWSDEAYEHNKNERTVGTVREQGEQR